MNAVVDNDILFKGLKYDLLPTLVTAVPGNAPIVGFLGVAFYVLNGLLNKSDPIAIQMLRVKLADFVQNNVSIEPTPNELILSAEFERLAQEARLSLDVGESQLCAIAISRAIPFVVTGDKRAVEAIERLLDHHSGLALLANRIFSLEQLVMAALTTTDASIIRIAICSHPEVDKTLTICFACHAISIGIEEIVACLHSYIAALRKKAPRALAI